MGNSVEDILAEDSQLEPTSKKKRKANTVEDILSEDDGDEVQAAPAKPQERPARNPLQQMGDFAENTSKGVLDFLSGNPITGGWVSQSQKEVAELQKRGPIQGLIDRAMGLALGPDKLLQDLHNTGVSAGVLPGRVSRDTEAIAAELGLGKEGSRTGMEAFASAVPIAPKMNTLRKTIAANTAGGAALTAATAPGQHLAETGQRMSPEELLLAAAIGGGVAGVGSGIVHGLEAKAEAKRAAADAQADLEYKLLLDESQRKFPTLAERGDFGGFLEGPNRPGLPSKTPIHPDELRPVRNERIESMKSQPAEEGLMVGDSFDPSVQRLFADLEAERTAVPDMFGELEGDLSRQAQERDIAAMLTDLGRPQRTPLVLPGIEPRPEMAGLPPSSERNRPGLPVPRGENWGIPPLEDLPKLSDNALWTIAEEAIPHLPDNDPALVDLLDEIQARAGTEAIPLGPEPVGASWFDRESYPDRNPVPKIKRKASAPEQEVTGKTRKPIPDDRPRTLEKPEPIKEPGKKLEGIREKARKLKEEAEKIVKEARTAKLENIQTVDDMLKLRGEAEARGVKTFPEDHLGTNAGQQTIALPDHIDGQPDVVARPKNEKYSDVLDAAPPTERFNPAELSDDVLELRLARYERGDVPNMSKQEINSRAAAIRKEQSFRKKEVKAKGQELRFEALPEAKKGFVQSAKEVFDSHPNLKDSPAKFEAFAEIVEAIVGTTAKRRGVTPDSLYENIAIKGGKNKSAKGSTKFMKDAGKAVINLFEGADISTALHEFSHVARKHLLDTDQLKVVEKSLGINDGKWTPELEEKYARAFERYLYDGTTPIAGLKKAFVRIKQWMREIYQKLQGSDLDVYVDEELRAHFDELLGASRMNERGGQISQERFRDAKPMDTRFEYYKSDIQELAALRRESAALEPKRERSQTTMREQNKTLAAEGQKTIGTGESYRMESRLVGQSGEPHGIPSSEPNPERLKYIRGRIKELNKKLGSLLKPGERVFTTLDDGLNLVISHDEKRITVSDATILKAAQEKHGATTQEVAAVAPEVDELFQLYPKNLRNQIASMALMAVKKLGIDKAAGKIFDYGGLATDLDILRQLDPGLHADTQMHLGQLMRIGKAFVNADNQAALAVATKEARNMTPADVAAHKFVDITPKQHKGLVELRAEMDNFAHTVKTTYEANRKGMDSTLKKVMRHQYEYVTGKDIDTGRYMSDERSMAEKTASHLLGGLYDAVVTGNYHIHGLHMIDAMLGAPATVGIKNAAKGAGSFLFDKDVRAFNKLLSGDIGQMKRMKADDPTFVEKRINRPLEGFINKTPVGRGLLKLGRASEGSFLESGKLDYLRASALHAIGKDMGMTAGELARHLTNDTLSPLQSQTAYAMLFHHLNEAVGYVPQGYHNRFGLERTFGKASSLVKLMQPFLGMRQVQSRLLMRNLKEGLAEMDVSKLAKFGTMLATIYMIGGAAAIPKPLQFLLGNLFPGKENELENALNETAPGPRMTGRTVEHIKLDIAPWFFGAYDTLTKEIEEAGIAAKSVRHLMQGKGLENHELKADAKILSILSGGSNILGVTSPYRIIAIKDAMDKAAAQVAEDKRAASEGEDPQATKRIFAFLNDNPGAAQDINLKTPFPERLKYAKGDKQTPNPDKIRTDQFQELFNYFLGAGVEKKEHHVRTMLGQFKRVQNDLEDRFDKKIAKQALDDTWEAMREQDKKYWEVNWDKVYEHAEELAKPE